MVEFSVIGGTYSISTHLIVLAIRCLLTVMSTQKATVLVDYNLKSIHSTNYKWYYIFCGSWLKLVCGEIF